MRILTKICIKCKDEKSINDFNKDKLRKDGLCPYCKKCQSEKNKKWRKDNPQKTKDYSKKSREKNRETIRIRNRKYEKSNREKIRTRSKKWRTKNSEKIKAKDKKYYHENYERNKKRRKEYMKIYKREKSRNDPIYRLNSNVRTNIWRSLKGEKGKRRWETLVNYTLEDLRKHLESQFKDGMTWQNYGKSGWEIDHRIPISLFNIKSYNSKGFKKCWALENLQPMWEKENITKSNKLFV